jgi:hypothetical protein
MLPQAGDLRLSVGLLADTEMVRAHLALESVPGRETPEAKRTALADARATQERTARSLEEIMDAYRTFRFNWELANMIPFTRVLAERQKKLADLSQKMATGSTSGDGVPASAQRRQAKVLELCQLTQPAFKDLGERLEKIDPILSKAFTSGGVILASDSLRTPMQQAAEDLQAGRWSGAAPKQAAAARELAALYEKLHQAQVEAARQALAALREKARSDKEAQKALEDIKAGLADSGVKDFDGNVDANEIVRMREVLGARPRSKEEEAQKPGTIGGDEIDVKKLELMRDSGVRQDPNILSLGKVAEKTPRLPDNAVDRERNKVRPFAQGTYQDLVGQLLPEADELQRMFQTLTLSTNQNNNDPGDVGKVGGRLNSTGAVAPTGNKKPPTINVGGVSRTGRSGARAYGSILGDTGMNRRGRDKAQEGEQRAPDQAGTIREQKSEDPYNDTSTGFGGKKVESEHETFNVKDTGKWVNDILKYLDKPQKKFSIVERAGDKFDPRLAALMRDTGSKQAQVIERLKTLRKELRNLYLPADHVDEALSALTTGMERLKDRPDAEMFRAQAQALDKLRGTLRVFQSAGNGLEPSVPRERVIRGRILDEPARAALPGYEEAVKRYYEKLAQ